MGIAIKIADTNERTIARQALTPTRTVIRWLLDHLARSPQAHKVIDPDVFADGEVNVPPSSGMGDRFYDDTVRNAARKNGHICSEQYANLESVSAVALVLLVAWQVVASATVTGRRGEWDIEIPAESIVHLTLG